MKNTIRGTASRCMVLAAFGIGLLLPFYLGWKEKIAQAATHAAAPIADDSVGNPSVLKEPEEEHEYVFISCAGFLE